MKNKKEFVILNSARRSIFLMLIVLSSIGAAHAATYTVLNNGDSGADTLRDAISQANATADNDIINFNASLAGQTITLTSGELAIAAGSGTLTINGLGASQLSVSGNNQSRIFNVASGATLTVNNLTMTAGAGAGGGCLISNGTLTINNAAVTNCAASGNGGGILNSSGTLTINSSVVSGSSATVFGGGITSIGTTTITRSSVSSNSAQFAGGLAIASGSSSSITDTTINSNTASNQYGGIYVQGSTGVTITNSTVSGNSAQALGGGISVNINSGVSLANCTVANNSTQDTSGGIFLNDSSVVTLSNTLIAANSPQNFFINSGGQVISGGYNLDTDGTSGLTNGVNGDVVGTSGSPIDAMLAPLANNGGPTQTRALMAGSPAIDKGNSVLTTDQRGAPRPFDNPSVPNAAGGNGSDIGAFEAQAAPTAATVSICGQVYARSAFFSQFRTSVTLTDQNGQARTIYTLKSGNFCFEDVEAGGTYILTAHSRGNVYAPQIVSATENLSGIIFTPTR